MWKRGKLHILSSQQIIPVNVFLWQIVLILMPVLLWISSARIFTYTAGAATATSDAHYRARNARPTCSHAGMVAQSTESPYQVARPPETPEKEGEGSRQPYNNYQGSEVGLRRGSSGEGLGSCCLNYLCKERHVLIIFIYEFTNCIS